MGNGLIVRADDFGSCHAADEAILAALASGCFVRNVSCMAGGTTIDTTAAALGAWSDTIDIGLHFTVTSEWDPVKWKPCMPRDAIPSLLNAAGEFYSSVQELADAHPRLEELMCELEAQRAHLAAQGLPLSYVDTHMLPDFVIPGLSERISRWALEKGLLYVRDYYSFPPAGMPRFAASEKDYQKNVEIWLDSFEPGVQYLYFMHPARLCDETMLFANEMFTPGVVAWERELEYRSAISAVWKKRMHDRDIVPLRYRDAQKPERHDVQEQMRIISGNDEDGV